MHTRELPLNSRVEIAEVGSQHAEIEERDASRGRIVVSNPLFVAARRFAHAPRHAMRVRVFNDLLERQLRPTFHRVISPRVELAACAYQTRKPLT